MPCHVETGGSEVFAQGIGALEVYALQHALLQFGRHWLASLAMQGIVVEDFRDGSKRLIELGGHLHEVAGHGSTAQTIVVAVREDTVEGMSKLMEERGHLIPSEQRGLAFRRFRIIAHVEDDGQLVITVALLGKPSIHAPPRLVGRRK